MNRLIHHDILAFFPPGRLISLKRCEICCRLLSSFAFKPYCISTPGLLEGTHASKSDTIGNKKVSSFALESEGIIEFGVKNNDEDAGSIKEGGNLNIKLNATQEDIEGGENNVALEMSAATTGALGKEEMMNGNSADSHAVQFDMENAGLHCGVATAEEKSGDSDGSAMDTAC